jgi:plasmid stabilization system protein ParE
VKVKFLKPAEAEFDDAVEYYNSEQKGLGLRFQAEVAHALSRVIQYPSSYQKIGKYSRRCLVYKFPYGIIYQHKEDKNEILIVAVSHLHRKPDYWYSRESKTV